MVTDKQKKRIWKRIRELLKEATQVVSNNPDYAEAFGMAMALHYVDGTDYPPESTSEFQKIKDEEREIRKNKESVNIV